MTGTSPPLVSTSPERLHPQGDDEALSQATRAAQRLSRKLPKLEGKAAAGGGELVRRREVHLWTVVAELGRLEAELEKSEAAGQRLRREVWRLKK